MSTISDRKQSAIKKQPENGVSIYGERTLLVKNNESRGYRLCSVIITVGFNLPISLLSTDVTSSLFQTP